MNNDLVGIFSIYWLGSESSREMIIDEQFLGVLQADYDLPDETISSIQLVLKTSGRAYGQAKQRANVDYASCRKELGDIQKAIKRLSKALDAASLDALAVIKDAKLARALAAVGPEGLWQSELEQGSEATVATESDLDQLRELLLTVEESVIDAVKFARGKKPGRPDDDAAFELMHAIMLVWSSILKREFRLDWARDGEPITDASRFCVSVARRIDPDISISRVATICRKVREKCLPISNLQEFPEILKEYRKRF
jgi:hypothetical protein